MLAQVSCNNTTTGKAAQCSLPRNDTKALYAAMQHLGAPIHDADLAIFVVALNVGASYAQQLTVIGVKVRLPCLSFNCSKTTIARKHAVRLVIWLYAWRNDLASVVSV
ncbi:MAG: hypothetical protein JO142_18230 [Burkholderiales bacterium]|nr:hypothetical protein [Burkholderiales bacterium]